MKRTAAERTELATTQGARAGPVRPDRLGGDAEDATYRRISSANTRRDLNPIMQERMQQVAYYLRVTVPLAKRIIEVITSYVVGEGFTRSLKTRPCRSDRRFLERPDQLHAEAPGRMDGRAQHLRRDRRPDRSEPGERPRAPRLHRPARDLRHRVRRARYRRRPQRDLDPGRAPPEAGFRPGAARAHAGPPRRRRHSERLRRAQRRMLLPRDQ
jgi:hypothetical protein